jgi:hypothetical protein
MSYFKWLLAKVIVTSIVLIYGTLTSLNLLFKWIQKGNSFWKVKERKVRPMILDEPSYGKHSFVQLKVSRVSYIF